MTFDAGWIKLYRSINSWSWSTCPNTSHLFMHLLLSASLSESEFLGNTVPSGSVIFGLDAWSKKTGLSVQKIRTSLEHLKSTSEITIKSTNKYSIITITSWDKYQSSNKQVNKQPTNNQQTTNNTIRSKNTISEEGDSMEPLDENLVIDKFNLILGGYGKIRRYPFYSLPPKSRELFFIFVGYREFSTIEKIESYFEEVKKSDFLTDGKKFCVDLMWLIDPDNAFKVMLGRFSNSQDSGAEINPFTGEKIV